MKNLYELDGCSAHLEPVISGPFKGTTELRSLHTNPNVRNNGRATNLMELICFDADVEQITLHLTARPVGDTAVTSEMLRHFYEKFGFEVYPGMGRSAAHSMLRKVHAAIN